MFDSLNDFFKLSMMMAVATNRKIPIASSGISETTIKVYKDHDDRLRREMSAIRAAG